MTRLIVISFAALGWCFYVMSGGPEFEPRGLRSEQPVRIAAQPSPTQIAPAPAEALVTNVAARTPTVRITPIKQQPEIVEFVAEPASLEGFNGLSVFDTQTSGIQLASLEDGVTGLKQVPAETQQADPIAPAEPEKDIREISGTRVNMRDGPGTIYPIIGKATIGQKVEILSDSGTGWLRLRVLPQQQVGWISASLVGKSTN
ncbi:SH3 domain-containing protein [Ruegeria lacuscaerulensis]|uniref:SH3 domain-containing protein n=1 Tax=Ruegeria lacuscaerulensis TaxID=55218 RepID=UPI001F37B359|nr:SH3 domain-containing protein [Ruegeria lacuscaerulensis]